MLCRESVFTAIDEDDEDEALAPNNDYELRIPANLD